MYTDSSLWLRMTNRKTDYFSFGIFLINLITMKKKHRLFHLIVGCFFIIIMLLFRTYYRPWIYANHLFDFYLADTYTNLFGECVVFFILVSLFSPNEMYKPIKLLLYSSCGLIIYELLGLIVVGGLCDYKDIIATFVGALLSYVINRMIILCLCFKEY